MNEILRHFVPQNDIGQDPVIASPFGSAPTSFSRGLRPNRAAMYGLTNSLDPFVPSVGASRRLALIELEGRKTTGRPGGQPL